MGVTRFRELPGVRVAYHVDGDGPPLVMVHGWCGSRADLDPLARDLATDHRVLSLDLPWHGQSTANSTYWTMDDLGALVDAIAVDEGMRGAPVVGHSLGAAVAVEAVLAGEGHHVVALDGLTFMHLYPRQNPAAVEQGLAPYRQDFPAGVRGLCERAAGPDPDPAFLEALADRMDDIHPAAAIEMMQGLMEWDMDAALARCDALGTRVDVIAARSMLSPSAIDAYGHRFDITVTDLGGHFFPLQDPAGTAALVRQALAVTRHPARGCSNPPSG